MVSLRERPVQRCSCYPSSLPAALGNWQCPTSQTNARFSQFIVIYLPFAAPQVAQHKLQNSPTSWAIAPMRGA
jgi:hypothetical protein